MATLTLKQIDTLNAMLGDAVESATKEDAVKTFKARCMMMGILKPDRFLTTGIKKASVELENAIHDAKAYREEEAKKAAAKPAKAPKKLKVLEAAAKQMMGDGAKAPKVEGKPGDAKLSADEIYTAWVTKERGKHFTLTVRGLDYDLRLVSGTTRNGDYDCTITGPRGTAEAKKVHNYRNAVRAAEARYNELSEGQEAAA